MKCQTGLRRSTNTAAHSRLAALLLGAVVSLASCTLFPAAAPTVLDYRVEHNDGGIRVEMSVAGGPRPVAWIGFGTSPLGGGLSARNIGTVSARTIAGVPMTVQPAGVDAYRVDVTTDEAWVFEYDVNIGSPPADFYHRASSASGDHMVLVGVDVWARVFDRASDVGPAPVERILGEVAEATVRFPADSLPRGWIVASAAPETSLNVFSLTDHPALSAFALGPYRVQTVDEDVGLRAAVHAGWDVARDQVVNYSRRLSRAQRREFGRPPGAAAMMIFTPLPSNVSPTQGVRTAGMVWDRSLLLFAGAGRSVPLDNDRVREMVAIFLGHELFHLYVPWGLPVTQPLSWLSEGWAEHVGRSSASRAMILSRAGVDRSLREAYDRYREMGGARAGSLQNASEFGGETLRPLLYVRGELVFRILSLEWIASGKQGSFDGVLWNRLISQSDGITPLEPQGVSEVLSAMVEPATVRRLVDGAAVITLPELELGRR